MRVVAGGPSLSRRSRRLVRGTVEIVRAVASMAIIEVLLRAGDLPRTCRCLGVALDLEDRPPASEGAVLPAGTRTALVAARTVAARWPAGDTCLRRCLLIGHRLRRLDPVLRIGVRREADGRFAAHSWLEFDGRCLDPAASAYHVLTAPGRHGGSPS